jgi:hypothetical protein
MSSLRVGGVRRKAKLIGTCHRLSAICGKPLWISHITHPACADILQQALQPAPIETALQSQMLEQMKPSG